MAIILRSLLLLATIGASTALFVQELRGDWLAPFISANTLTLPNRTRLIVGMVIGAAVFLLVGVGALRWDDGKRVRRMAHLLAPGILLGLLPPFFLKAAWPNPLDLAFTIGLFLLLAERLYRMSFAALGEAVEARVPGVADNLVGRWAEALRTGAGAVGRTLFSPRARRWLPLSIVLTATVGYAIYMSVFTLFMHGRFQTYGYDLGQYDNIFYTTLHGHWMRDTPLHFDRNWEQLRGHAELSVFFFLPFYAIKPGAQTLLVIHSCMIALGAIPLYRFAARRLPRAYAALLALAYLLYPPTHGLQFYDIHFQPISAAFVLMVIDFVDDRRWWLCGVAFVLALGCREDVSIGLAMLGTFLMVTGHRVRAGAVMAVTATIYFVLMRFIIMPSFGPFWFQDTYKELQPQGAPNFGGIIATLISNPIFTVHSMLTTEKLRYALQLLLPLAFLPVRRSWLAISFVPGSIFTILTTQYAPTIDIGFQYSGHFLPYLFAAAALCLTTYPAEGPGRERRPAALATLVTATILCGIHWGAIPPRDSIHGGFNTFSMRPPTAADRQKDKDLKELNAMVPPTASVAMSEAEMPHVSRLWMRTLRDSTDADYLLYGTSSGYAGATNAERVLAAGEFERVAERPGLMLLRRKGLTPRTAAPLVPPPPARAPAAPAPITPPVGSPRGMAPPHAPAAGAPPAR
jgi:uncharacterized membrane protein